ncbi:MAG TPA: hypothetical protein VFE54_09710, partial [Mucilaginibacter sp.]|nr:hypothetical protein [Mucilaginibacter sp.]
MKKLSLALVVLMLIVRTVSAQNTTLKVTLANSSSTSCYIQLPAINFYSLKKGSFDILLNASGTGM